jgi:hypothetical protein
MSGVFQNIDPPPPSPPGECVPPRLWCGGRTHSLGEEGGGGSIIWKTPDTALYSVLCDFNYSTLYLSYMMFIKYVPDPLGPFPAAASLDAPVPRTSSDSGRPRAARRSCQHYFHQCCGFGSRIRYPVPF